MAQTRATPPVSRVPAAPPVWQAVLTWLAGSLLAAQSAQQWLSSQTLASQFVSTTTWVQLAERFSSRAVLPQQPHVEISYLPVLLLAMSFHLTTWLIGTLWFTWRGAGSWLPTLCRWGVYGGGWWCLLGGWDWISLLLQLLGAEFLVVFWGLLPTFWCAMCLAGWLTTFLTLKGAVAFAKPQATVGGDAAMTVWPFIALYAAVFVTMNWRLYFNLLIPHGDSAMYEEHLWNLTHGKGFRSYLDQGLFLGEHIQVVHLGLLPAYCLWPSHLLLELCESLALALGAWPVYWMTRRHSALHRAGLAAAAAYLLYVPLQYLDIEIDLKTFRPEAFGIPILLLTLDQLDRRSLRGTLLGILGCLTVKEDYAIILAPLGLWIAVTNCGLQIADCGFKHSATAPTVKAEFDRRWVLFGVLLTVGSIAYLYLATRVLMPWFRSGAEIHYANYFKTFGETPEQIVRTMLTNPRLLFTELFQTSTMLYALMLLAPVAFVPLGSPSRLAVGLPLFGILCLNELARDPWHHFHAPLVAIAFWALAGGWPRVLSIVSRRIAGETAATAAMRHILWTSSLATGVFFSIHPLSLTFWDSGSEWHWKKLYGTSRRAEEFAEIADLIPRSARVASTDFVHPRYTHHERSYDYSGYRRKVSDYENKVPDDTDYIVIDTQHRYSVMKVPAEVPEYRDHPDQWELLPDETHGYFIVLKRRK